MIEESLLVLDQDPVKLESMLAAQKDRRLGNYFETLWAFALELNPRYQLLERNLQINDGQNTLGEMDFIVLDNKTGRCAHWELAIKFYLGAGDTTNQAAWHGPGKKDRLDLKVGHLLSRQTLLSAHPVAKAALQQRAIKIDDCAVIFKGRLFYPWQQSGPEFYPQSANTTHFRGKWLKRERFLQVYDADARFLPLIRSGWMAGVPAQRARVYTTGGLIRRIDAGDYRFPLYVSRFEGEIERERLFIVDNNWPDIKT